MEVKTIKAVYDEKPLFEVGKYYTMSDDQKWYCLSIWEEVAQFSEGPNPREVNFCLDLYSGRPDSTYYPIPPIS